MKKLIVLYILFLITFPINAQIKTKAFIDFGYDKWNHQLIEQNDVRVLQSGKIPLSTHLVFKVTWKGFKGSTELITKMNKNKATIKSTPVYSEYRISFGYAYKRVSLHYEHGCIHTTLEPTTTTIYKGGYDKIFLRLKLWVND